MTLKVKVDRDKCQATRVARRWLPNCSSSMSSAMRARRATDRPRSARRKGWIAEANFPEEAIEIEEKA